MLASKTLHFTSFLIGLFFLLLSLYLAFFVPHSFFYTSFAFGTWLMLDFIDYKLNGTSILAFFYNHKHRYGFYTFFLVSSLFCFTVDYVWGVRILQVWEWTGYGTIEFLRMYLIMNASFVLGMYELYRVIKTLLKPYIADEHVLSLKAPYDTQHLIYAVMLVLGIVFLVSPLFLLITSTYDGLSSYVMILPFLSITCIADAITYFTGGEPVLRELIRLNRLRVIALSTTVILAFAVTEGLNLFGREWKYLKMPFFTIQVLGIPASVFIGWIPLVIGCISMINLAKHLNYVFSVAPKEVHFTKRLFHLAYQKAE